MLAEAQKAFAKIVVSPDADRVTAFASRELQSYLSRISGVHFEIIKDVDCPGKALFITAGGVKWITASFDNDKKDIFELLVNKDGVSIQGSNGRSVLYGVYDFLELLGCAFVEPGRETVPELEKLEVPFMERRSAAAFDLRNIFRIQIVKSKHSNFDGIESGHHLPQIDWMAKQRLNHYVFYVDYYRYDLWEKYKHQVLDALLDRGFRLEVTHHSMLYFFPSDENCNFGNYDSSTYKENHSEWYIPSGLYGGGYQVRVELPEVREIIKERVLDYFRRNPELETVGLWPGDSAMNRLNPDLSFTDGYLEFWNDMSDAVKQEFPDKKLCMLSYFEITPPPEKVSANKNLHNWFCRHDDNYFYPITDERNQKYLDMLEGWTKKMNPSQIACFHYYGWMPIFTPFTENMKLDLNVYKEMKLAGVYGWSGFTYNIMGNDFRWARDLYVFAHLLWEPEQAVEPLEQKWAKGIFANSASEILEFFNTLKQVHRKESKKGLLGREPWISLDLLHDLQKILARARDKAEKTEILYRIDLLEQVAAAGCTARVQRKPLSGIERAF
jgi:hypothetical protein